MSDGTGLPRWDMGAIYSGPASPEFGRDRDALLRETAALAELFDAHGVGRREPAPADEATVGAAEAVIAGYNRVFEAAHDLASYLTCVVATDADDEAAQAALSELRQHGALLTRLAARFTAWAGSLDVDALIARSDVARAHAFALRDARRGAAHLMGAAEEELAADLGPSAGAAWAKLRDDLEARLMVRLEGDGEPREIPLTEAFNLAYDPDRATRRRAHEACIAAVAAAAVPLAAALNGVKGETVTLAARRGWADPLDAALVTNRIDRATLDALNAAIREAVPDYRRYLRAKARALGLPVLADWDRFAPVGTDRDWAWDEATALVRACFGAYGPRLLALAERALAESWVDADPRAGKVAGGFCAYVGKGQSRILLNYAPTYNWMAALAHELGHAYHNAVLIEAGRSWLQAPSPHAMTLAETASTFCETLAQRAALARAAGAEELAILDGAMQGVGGNVFGAAIMFAFERDLFAARRRRELSAAELNDLWQAAADEVRGDAVEAGTGDPHGWAAPHFAMPDLWYYNFPYAFGFLFGLGLYARYEADPPAFRAGFDDLLSRTGMAEAADLAAGFGIDLRAPEFWRAGLDLVRTDVDRFEVLVGVGGRE